MTNIGYIKQKTTQVPGTCSKYNQEVDQYLLESKFSPTPKNKIGSKTHHRIKSLLTEII